ncbi:cps23fF [Streptococcus pneumoniae 2070335]|nr:cps23fF [Streptococcus pneumoniae 2070335]
MVKHADLLVCDSKNIEKYIQEDYIQYQPKTTYIAYGTDTTRSTLNSSDEKVRAWFKEKNVSENEYYLVVGRFVPENNYESMIRGFLASSSKKDFVLITNVEQNKFYNQLLASTGFDKDPRVKFVGTVYDQELLKYIRENAFAYFHGHEVGGTNPSLLEALASTKLNLLLDVGFNREVGEQSAIYWKKDELSQVIGKVEQFDAKMIDELDRQSNQRIGDYFTWEKIVTDYEKLFKK